MKSEEKVYLGDSVYLETSGEDLILTNGWGPGDETILDTETVKSLLRVISKFKGEK